jgi:hypothetical protein
MQREICEAPGENNIAMRFPIISSVSAVTVAVTALLALEAVGCHPAVSAGAHVSWSAKNAAIRLDVSSDGSYTVSRAGAVWLTSAPVALHVGGEWYVSGTPGADQQALTLTKSTVIQGADKLGRFTGLEDDWAAGETPFVTRFRFYADNGGAVIFEQSLPQGGQGMTVGVSTGGGFHEVSTAFPSFHLSGKTSSLNYLTYDGTFATPTKGVGLQRFPGGTDGGSPLVLYDNQLKFFCPLTIISRRSPRLSLAYLGVCWRAALKGRSTAFRRATTRRRCLCQTRASTIRSCIGET